MTNPSRWTQPPCGETGRTAHDPRRGTPPPSRECGRRRLSEVSLAERQSPLDEAPLRVPGQSVQEDIDRLLIDELFVAGAIAVLALAWPTYEWARWLTKAQPSPWLVTILAALAFAYSLLRLASARRRLESLKLGRDGERAVAEELDNLRSTGAIVLHDIVVDRLNIDHVVLSARGIYAIETKTLSKPRGGKVSFDGTTLLVNGRTLDRDPIAQATAAADWIRKTLRKVTTKDYPVRPVLLLPGWYVNPVREHRGAKVWVLTPGAVFKFVQREPAVVSEDDLRFAVFFLARYIKTHPGTDRS
jgi:hypothetical protein